MFCSSCMLNQVMNCVNSCFFVTIQPIDPPQSILSSLEILTTSIHKFLVSYTSTLALDLVTTCYFLLLKVNKFPRTKVQYPRIDLLSFIEFA